MRKLSHFKRCSDFSKQSAKQEVRVLFVLSSCDWCVGDGLRDMAHCVDNKPSPNHLKGVKGTAPSKDGSKVSSLYVTVGELLSQMLTHAPGKMLYLVYASSSSVFGVE